MKKPETVKITPEEREKFRNCCVVVGIVCVAFGIQPFHLVDTVNVIQVTVGLAVAGIGLIVGQS